MNYSQQFQIMFYSTSIFERLDPRWAPLMSTFGIGLLNVFMSFASIVLIERAGRRILLLVGFGGLVIATIGMTISLEV